MPNWCENHLTIHTELDKVQDVCDALEGPYQAPFYVPEKHRRLMTVTLDDTGHIISEPSELSFPKLVPLPEDVLEADNPDHIRSSEVDEFHPASNYWGTKWPPSNVHRHVDGADVVFTFSTAWGPPFPVVDAIAKLLPDTEIDFVFAEPGMLFSGERTYVDGELDSEDISEEDDFVDFITNHPELGFDPMDFIDEEDEE